MVWGDIPHYLCSIPIHMGMAVRSVLMVDYGGKVFLVLIDELLNIMLSYRLDGERENTMKLINLTPHSINFVTAEGTPLVTVEPSGLLARVTAHTVTTGSVSVGDVTLPVTGTTYGEVESLPAPEEGTIYIVSSLVASRCPDRADVFIPNESVRDDKGRIVGCKSLGRV